MMLKTIIACHSTQDDVEISDLVWAGGMQIACLDDDEKQRYILWILPIRKGCK
jgi:hypothetical protein